MDNKIFNYFYKEDNDLLSKLDYQDTRDLLELIKKYYIEYRDVLKVDRTIPFGTEMEFEHSDRESIEKDIYNTYFETGIFEVKDEISVDEGGEINTPVLYNNKATWKDLKLVSDILSKYSKEGDKASFQVHVCSKVFEDNLQYLLNFLKLWEAYENVIYRFLYGEYCCERPKIRTYAEPIAENCKKLLNREYDDIYHLLTKLCPTRHLAINFCNVKDFKTYLTKNTIECRVPNGSLNPIIWQNNINLVVSLIEYSKSKDFNNEIINNRIFINEEIYNSFKDSYNVLLDFDKYNLIYRDQAFELADLIFNNNLDKINFLRQYFKDFSENKIIYEKCKSFTK